MAEKDSRLSHKACVPCEGGMPALKGEQIETLRGQLADGWHVVDEHHLEKEYQFDNFVDALDFANDIGAIAEHEGHHPDIYLAYGLVKLTIWTHKVDGLTESDFILAAKADQAYGEPE